MTRKLSRPVRHRLPLLPLACIAVLLGHGAFPVHAQVDAQPSLPASALTLDDLRAFADPPPNWQIAGGVMADPDQLHDLRPESGAGILVNVPGEGAAGALFSEWQHGDLDLDLEVLMPRGSNSGIYLQGRYELQLLDSWGSTVPTHGSMGGIYERWDESRPEGQEGYQGRPPRVNAARAPGLWQQLQIRFRAPKFDERGRKISNARFVRVVLNGAVLHEDVEVTGPTRGAAFDDEQPSGPLMIQGDHGPVAFRNISFKRYDRPAPRLSDVRYQTHLGEVRRWEDLEEVQFEGAGSVGAPTWEVAGTTDEFAIAYQATFSAPTSGEYLFELQCSGGCGLEIGDVLEMDHGRRTSGGLSQAQSVRLDEGEYPVRLTYFKSEGWWRPTLGVFVEGPGFERAALHAPPSMAAAAPTDPIPLNVGGEPIVLRSFMQHGGEKRTHVVSVGSPGGAHFSYDLEEGSLLRVWRGDFLDVTEMWQERGEPQLAYPRGAVLDLVRTPILGPDPADANRGDAFRYAGYELDKEGYPTFAFLRGDLEVTDHLMPHAEGREIRRTIVASRGGGSVSEDAAREAQLCLVTAPQITAVGEGTYIVGDREYYLIFDQPAPGVSVVQHDNGMQELTAMVPAEGGTLTYAVRW